MVNRGGSRETNVFWKPSYDLIRFNSTAEKIAEGPTGRHQDRQEMGES
jgi:hypothetical protein